MKQLFTDDQIEAVKAQNDIVSVISEHIELQLRDGQRYWGKCPFHSAATASFMVNAELQVYFCFACQQHGNVITFVMQKQQLSFAEAVQALSSRRSIRTKTECCGNLMDYNNIDQRSLEIARAVVTIIDSDPHQLGLQRAIATLERWRQVEGNCWGVQTWSAILAKPWPEIRAILLDDTETGQQLRACSPFAGILPNHVRLSIYRQYRSQ